MPVVQAVLFRAEQSEQLFPTGVRVDFRGGSLSCVGGVVPLSRCAGTVSVWVFHSDTLAVVSAVGLASFCAVPWGFSTSVFFSACAVSASLGTMLLSEEEIGSGVSAICEALLHPVVRHRSTASKRTAIFGFIRFTPFDHILPDENCSDKGAF